MKAAIRLRLCTLRAEVLNDPKIIDGVAVSLGMVLAIIASGWLA
jgi:hypothetical protein